MFLTKFMPSVIVEVTDRCNLRCPFCYEAVRRENRDMDLEVFKRMLREYRPILLQITGGEASLHRKIDELVKWALRRVFAVVITTNGTGGGRPWEFLRDAGRKPMIGVSVDAIGEAHDLIRGRNGLFSEIEQTIGALRSWRVPHSLVCTVFGPGRFPQVPEGNLVHVPVVLEWAAQQRLPILFQPFNPADERTRVELGEFLLRSKSRWLINSRSFTNLFVSGNPGKCRYNALNVSVGADGDRLPTRPGDCYFCDDCSLCFYNCVWEPSLMVSRKWPDILRNTVRNYFLVRSTVRRHGAGPADAPKNAPS